MICLTNNPMIPRGWAAALLTAGRRTRPQRAQRCGCARPRPRTWKDGRGADSHRSPPDVLECKFLRCPERGTAGRPRPRRGRGYPRSRARRLDPGHRPAGRGPHPPARHLAASWAGSGHAERRRTTVRTRGTRRGRQGPQRHVVATYPRRHVNLVRRDGVRREALAGWRATAAGGMLARRCCRCRRGRR